MTTDPLTMAQAVAGAAYLKTGDVADSVEFYGAHPEAAAHRDAIEAAVAAQYKTAGFAYSREDTFAWLKGKGTISTTRPKSERDLPPEDLDKAMEGREF